MIQPTEFAQIAVVEYKGLFDQDEFVEMMVQKYDYVVLYP